MAPPHTALMNLHGIFPPVTTPFDHDGNLYKAKVRHNVEKWNLTVLAGYAVCGSTGESVFLTEEEKIQLFGWVAEYASPEKLLIAGTGMESVRETVSLTNQAAAAGYKVAMVRTPHYYKNLVNNAAAQMLFFRAVADQVRIPVMIYNVPEATGVDISADAVVQLSEHPNIVGLKEDLGKHREAHEDGSRSEAGLPGAGRLGPDALAVPDGGRCRCRPRLCQCRAVLDHRALGGLSYAGIRSCAGLAGPHLPGRRARDIEIRHPRPQVRDGPQRLLRRTSSSPAHHPLSGSQTRDRTSLHRPERLNGQPASTNNLSRAATNGSRFPAVQHAYASDAVRYTEKGMRGRVLVFYDNQCEICQTGIAWLRRLDRSGRTECLPLDAAVRAGLDSEACARRIHVLTPERRILAGWDAVAYLARLFPLTWLIGALGVLPGLRNPGRLLYDWIANNRCTLSRRRGAVCRRIDADG